MLAHSLQSTGVVGNPDECFLPERVESPFEDYLGRVFEAGTTPNGVFAAKLMWNYFDDFLFRLRRSRREYEAPDLQVMRSVFPDPSFVWIRREDTVAQGISWARAAQTGKYAGTVLGALSFLGLEPLPERAIGPPPELTKQADAVTEEWISRYRELSAV